MVITSSILQEIRTITDTDSSYVVDRCKIRQKNVRIDLKSQFAGMGESWGIFFDGRKDDT